MKCQKCQTDNLKAFTYCNNCGTKIHAAVGENYNVSLNRTKIFFFVLLGYIASLHLIKYKTTYVSSLITDLIFAGIVITFTLLNFKSLKPLFRLRNIDARLLILVSVSLCIFAGVMTIFAGFLNNNVFGVGNNSYYEHYKNSPSPLLFCILSIGVFPAIFEEIAFRGVLFSELKNVMPVNATILLSTMLFTILHFSFISFLWIFPIGLLFGYLRAKYDTLLYGIVGHFVYNSSLVLIEYFSI